jgi:hypothetical protein
MLKARLGAREEGVRLLREALEVFLLQGGEGHVETLQTRCAVASALPRAETPGRDDADDALPFTGRLRASAPTPAPASVPVGRDIVIKNGSRERERAYDP